MIRKLGLIFLIQVICISLSFAGTKKIASAQFLKLGLGARAVAMGGAYSAVSDEVNAIYWNPSGLTQIEGKRELSLMHALWLEEITFDYLAYCQKGLGGVIGLGVNYLNSGEIKKYDTLGNNLNKTYAATDMIAAISYAFKINKLSLGINLKQIASKIEEEQSSSYAADIGLFVDAWKKLKIGLSAQNFGTEVKFRNTSEQLPQITRLGLAYKLDNFILSADGILPSDDDIDVRVGLEYIPDFITKNFALRAGYKTKAASDFESMAGITAGFGVKLLGFGLDYAMDTFGDLGYTHMVSLAVKFGLPKEEKPVPVKETVQAKQPVAVKTGKIKMQNVAVVDFQAIAPISMSEATFTTEIFRSSLVRAKKYKIVDRNNMEKVLAEQGFQQTGCTTNECAVQMGKLLNVNKIISGTFGKLGKHYLLTISVLDVETSEIIHSDKASCKELNPDEVQLMTNGLIQRLLKELE